MPYRKPLAVCGLAVLLACAPALAQDDATERAVEDSKLLQSEPESISDGADPANAPPAKTDHGVSYRTGGIGKDERDALLLVTRSDSLKVVFAGSADRAFVADASIRVLDDGGRTVLEAGDVGPLFFADLPPGSYRVEATFQGRTQQKPVALKRGRQTAISFAW
jgi:hypothetical protein